MTIIETRLRGQTVSIEGSGGVGVPAGGLTNQSLAKASSSDFDLKWHTPAGAGDMLVEQYDPDGDGFISYEDLSNKPNHQNLPLNVVVVNSLSDFPLQDATTITLESGMIYKIGQTISTDKKFILQNGCCLTAQGALFTLLIYTGTEAMLNSVNATYLIADIGLSCPNGDLINFQGDGISILERLSLLEVKNIGSVNGNGLNNFTNCNWSNCNFTNVTGDGLHFYGDINILSLSRVYCVSSSPTHKFINLNSAIFQTIELRDVELFGVAGSVGIKGLPNSANLQPNKLAIVTSCGLNGNQMTALEGLTISDVRWTFNGNSGVEDTIEDAIIHFRGNVSETVILAPSLDSSNAVKVNAVWESGRFSKFTFSSNGRITYMGERPVTLPIDLSLHLISVGGQSIVCTIYIAKNGVPIMGTGSTADLSGNTSKNITVPWQVTLNNGDYIEAFIENETNSNNIIVKQGILRVR